MIMHQPQHTSLVQGVSKSSILFTIIMLSSIFEAFGWSKFKSLGLFWRAEILKFPKIGLNMGCVLAISKPLLYLPLQFAFCQDIRRFNLKASGLSLHHHFSPDQDFSDNFYLFLPFVMKTFNICYEFVSTWNSSSDFYHIHILQHFSCFTHGYYNTIPTDSLGPILTSLEDLGAVTCKLVNFIDYKV